MAKGIGGFYGFLVPGSSSGFSFRVLVPGSEFWPVSCTGRGMTGKKSPEEFDAWQLAWELKERVFALTSAPPASGDHDFCDDIRKAARSAPDNIAEGFYRFAPTDFANFVRIAKGSLGEVRNQLMHARAHSYLDDAEYAELSKLCHRAIKAATGLRLYLLRLPKNFDPRRRPRNGESANGS